LFAVIASGVTPGANAIERDGAGRLLPPAKMATSFSLAPLPITTELPATVLIQDGYGRCVDLVHNRFTLTDLLAAPVPVKRTSVVIE